MMLSEYIPLLWAKSEKDTHLSDKNAGHPVIAHLLDVAASTWEILELEPKRSLELYSQDFGLAHQQSRAWLCALAGLHDLGKISPAFQQKWSVGKERLWHYAPAFRWGEDNLAPQAPPEDSRHNWISQHALVSLLHDKGIAFRAAEAMADAVGCHHGFRAKESELDKAKKVSECGQGIWQEARAEVFAVVLTTLQVDSLPTIRKFSAAAFMRLAGITSFADWIGSSFSDQLHFADYHTDLTEYFHAARSQARKRLQEFGWTKRVPLAQSKPSYQAAFDYLLPAGQKFMPRTLQKKVAELLEDSHEPTLLIIEAPMGEGKTEAAFYAHLQLQYALEHRGLYIALPTMATGNAMFERTVTFLNAQTTGRDIPVDLQLLHGAKELNQSYLLLQDKFRTNLPDDGGNVVAAEFFSQKKRALLSEYGVGTVDQALLSVLNISHQFVRLWGLGNRVVVLDEIHAYDTYTSKLIVTLVQWLHALGSSVILMSATLPNKTRQELSQAYGAAVIDEEKMVESSKTNSELQAVADTEKIPPVNAYPRISKISAGKTSLLSFAAEPSRRVTIYLEKLSYKLEDIAICVQEALSAGGCAVCIVNTVERAQQLYKLLAEQEQETEHPLECYLFHARFPAEERSAIENQVLELFGKDASLENGKRPPRAVLVATQVVEQSLDLDFDVMISDVAPVDLLIQRAGRMWRHKREQRPVARAQLFIAGMRFSAELPDIESAYWHKIYHPFILYKTWEALQDKRHLTLPDDIDILVQQVYNDDDIKLELSLEARETIQSYNLTTEQSEHSDIRDAAEVVISHFSQKYNTLQLRAVEPCREEDDLKSKKPIVQTRKGPISMTVIPFFQIDGSYFLDRTAQRPYKKAKDVDLYKRAVRISRGELVGYSKYGTSPLELYNQQQGHDALAKSWRRSSLLRNCVPLVLDSDGIVVVDKLTTILHPELGLQYQRQ